MRQASRVPVRCSPSLLLLAAYCLPLSTICNKMLLLLLLLSISSYCCYLAYALVLVLVVRCYCCYLTAYALLPCCMCTATAMCTLLLLFALHPILCLLNDAPVLLLSSCSHIRVWGQRIRDRLIEVELQGTSQ
jgi:hypothetical protein